MKMKSLLSYLLNLIKPKSSYISLNRATISSKAIQHNFNIFQKHKPHYSLIPVLKSNAYGHGIKHVAKIVNSIPECKLIAIDSYPEYQIIYHHTGKDILLLGETLPENYTLFDVRRTHFAVRSESIVHVLGQSNRPIQIQIFINTGMNREGVKPGKDLEKLLKTIVGYKNITISGIMSHLACADDKDSPYNQSQSDIFHASVTYIMSQGIRPTYIHLEASAGMIQHIDNHKICNAGRLGLGLYGLDPIYKNGIWSSIGLELQCTLDLYSTITAIQQVKHNEIVGYSATWKAKKDQGTCTFPLGYKEGTHRSLSGTSYQVCINGCYEEIIGRVSMNYSCCTNIHNHNIGDIVHVLSSTRTHKNSIYTFFDHQDKIVYELVTLDDKIKRVVID